MHSELKVVTLASAATHAPVGVPELDATLAEDVLVVLEVVVALVVAAVVVVDLIDVVDVVVVLTEVDVVLPVLAERRQNQRFLNSQLELAFSYEDIGS